MSAKLGMLEIQWSPVHPNKFITWDTEIYLYEVFELKDNQNVPEQSCIKLSETTAAKLITTNSNNHFIKCIDIYPKDEPDILLAVGQTNGKVNLTSFGHNAFHTLGIVGREFVPKHARQCNAVSWNPVDSDMLAVGLDKHRNDHSILLWDMTKNPSSSERMHHHTGTVHQAEARPISEYGVSETTHSLAWFRKNYKCLAAGLNNKQIKIIDFRDAVKVVNTTQTKAVYNLMVNPHNDNYLVSHIEQQILIWDTRSFEKPVLTLPQSRQVTKVLWCPTRHNLLGSLQKDSGSLHLHDIQLCGSCSGEDPESSAFERTAAPPPWSNPVSFSWHPTHANRLLAISSKEMIDYTISERITLNWSTRSVISWNYASKCFKYINSNDPIYKSLGDISSLTKSRAVAEYGLLVDLSQNGELAKNNTLKKLWQWLYLSRSLVEDKKISSPDNKHPGVRTILKLGSLQSGFEKSEIAHRPWTDIGSNNASKIYTSSDREKALQLCGWDFENDANSSHVSFFLENLEREGEYERAAAIAVFSSCLRQAMDILTRGVNKTVHGMNLSIVAMALSGFSEEKNSMWRELCLKTSSQLFDPYLRAIFAFLTADVDSYENVLNESGMAVEDRVAFALTFLSDNKLCEYLQKLTSQMIEQGDLSGFLLTGASLEGIQMLNRYLEITGDVQTCSLIAIQTFPVKLIQENQVQVWISSYRNLLDAWKMWTQRAHFDIAMSSITNEKPHQQIYISCNFCGKNVSAFAHGTGRGRGTYGRLGSNTSNKLKMSACPHCRKPLPRCAICLMHMGTVSGSQAISSGSSKNEEESGKMSTFNSWFTWCQTCRHGGHTDHISHWFKQHMECPVTSCNCRCLSLDAGCRERVGFKNNCV